MGQMSFVNSSLLLTAGRHELSWAGLILRRGGEAGDRLLVFGFGAGAKANLRTVH
jgi:3-hydroxy-3-methylglutaryl CoA synthase